MSTSFLFHPAATFVIGALVGSVGLAALLSGCTPTNRTALKVDSYRAALDRAGKSGPAPGSAAERAALERFTGFLQHIGDQQYIRDHTAKTYRADAFLDDTLSTHHGAADIEAYFLKTAQSLTQAQVTIDDISRSGADHYIRWTMVMAAKPLAGGKPVHSIGISQVRFDPEGKVALHQDFWDSGENFFGRLPVSGGVIGLIRKRLQ